ncbi:lipopolysaccharide biosynthesis protein [Halobacteriovorax marinus SJ]|uniref:Lipopolysaccharide biosynthesis protein n=1 Tax=Halobacteriovorax marinus (strain ATCC BAA-682 / DSM 15412 / SJ) TaxID=862908 RepID=E1X3T7_HALMS|nr:UDP-4-amino-4,6-dideoxy-N-acetyl-beta-L-altrosamine transaminase [Halobacteriovorax marinus]CBW25277.1 lipopolysaccharide biosynthesis protein [Halobacteriovorax marinus SJ]
MDKKIPYGRQEISKEDIDLVVSTLKSDFLTQGPRVVEFENAFASQVKAEYALSCSNGTAALHLAMMALDLKPGEKVLTTSITFAASANCVLYQGGVVEFIDISLDDYLLDLDLLERHLSGSDDKYAGIIVVDFAGFPVDLERLRKIADQYGMWIVEDACHAPGASFTDSKGEVQPVGGSRYADLTLFSFHPVKHIACGEGGMITTHRNDLFKRLEMLRSHGITKNKKDLLNQSMPAWFHEMQELGYNYRISDIQAALGLSQLTKLESSVRRRNEIAKIYLKELASLPLVLPNIPDEIVHALHLFVVRTSRRDELYSYLSSKGIFTQVHYIPVYLHPYYSKKGYEKGLCPVAEEYFDGCLSLPMYPSMSSEDISYVVKVIVEFFSEVDD